MSPGMVSRDYRKEVGITAVEAKVAWPVAVVICAACVGAVLWAAATQQPMAVEPPEPAPAKTVVKR
jgi:hypothetical protein